MARGPAYPSVDLEQAVDFTRRMYQFTKRSPADANAVVEEAWNYSPTSSGSKKLLAALKYYGLIEDASTTAESRMIRLSDRAFRILVDEPSSPERKQALQDAALSPKAYSMCWERWGAEMPPSMRSNLIFGEGFIESTVDGFIADYKKSLEIAGLIGSDGEHKEEPTGSVEPPMFLVQSKNDLTASPSLPPTLSTTPVASDDQRSDVFSLNEGTVSLFWPKTLSAESFEDLSDWLDLLKRKIERSVIRPPKG